MAKFFFLYFVLEMNRRMLILNYVVLAATPLAPNGFAPRGDKKKIKAKFVKGPRKSSTTKKTKKGPRKS